MRTYRLIIDGLISSALIAFLALVVVPSISTTSNRILLAQKVASADPTRDPNGKSGGNNDSRSNDRKDAGKSGGDSDKGKGGSGSADGGGKAGSKTGKA